MKLYKHYLSFHFVPLKVCSSHSSNVVFCRSLAACVDKLHYWLLCWKLFLMDFQRNMYMQFWFFFFGEKIYRSNAASFKIFGIWLFIRLSSVCYLRTAIKQPRFHLFRIMTCDSVCVSWRISGLFRKWRYNIHVYLGASMLVLIV